MLFSRLCLAITFLYCSSARAQMPISPSECVGTISSFPNCNSVTTTLARCNSLTDKKAIVNCICTQSFINQWVGCKSETRQCALSTTYDSMFDSYLVEWHGACDTYLSASITTPPVVQPTAILEQGVCESIYETCNRWSRGASSCSTSRGNGADVTSCRCAKSMLSLASVCKVDGSRSCLQSAAAVTQLWEYQNCPGGSTFFAAAAVTTATTNRPGTTSPLSVPAPSVTPEFGPQVTPSSTRSSSSWANPTAIGPALYSPLLRAIVLMQRLPYVLREVVV